MKYKYNDTVHLIGYGQVKVIAVNTNESYSNLTTYDLKDVLEDGLNTFYSVCDERIERLGDKVVEKHNGNYLIKSGCDFCGSMFCDGSGENHENI